MHTLLSAQVTYDAAAQRRHTLVTKARTFRLARMPRTDTDIGFVHAGGGGGGTVVSFAAVAKAPSNIEHASARVA